MNYICFFHTFYFISFISLISQIYFKEYLELISPFILAKLYLFILNFLDNLILHSLLEVIISNTSFLISLSSIIMQLI